MARVVFMIYEIMPFHASGFRVRINSHKNHIFSVQPFPQTCTRLFINSCARILRVFIYSCARILRVCRLIIPKYLLLFCPRGGNDKLFDNQKKNMKGKAIKNKSPFKTVKLCVHFSLGPQMWSGIFVWQYEVLFLVQSF